MAVLDELLVRLAIDSSGVDEGTSEVTRKLDGLAAPAAVAGGLAGAVFVAGISQAMDISSAQTKLQNQLGLTEVEAERAGGVAGDVFSAGFGASLDEVNTALGGIHSGIGDLGDFTEDELQDMSKQALGLAKTFETDVADATGAVGQLIKTGLVKDATEGFDLVTKAMQTVPAELRDDLLPTIQEYSTQFRRIGLDGQTSMGLLQQAVQAGARDLDQVADGLGQFGERALAGGKDVDEAFKSIGLSSKDMTKLMKEGGTSAEKALQMTMDALRGTSDEQVKLNAAAALFGDPANVMGEALFALDPATAAAATGMDRTSGAAKGLTDAMEDDPAQQMDNALRTLQTTLGEALLPLVKEASDFFTEHKDALQILIPVILVVVTVLGVMAAVIWLVNIAMLANPVAWIVLGILALIAVIILVIVYWDEIKAATKEAWDRIVQVLKQAWEWIKSTARETWDSLSRKTKEAWDWIGRKVREGIDKVRGWIETLREIPGKVAGWLGKIVDWVRGMPGRIRSAASGMWDGIKNSFRTAVNWLIGRWNNFSLTLGGGSIMGVSIPSVTLSTPNLPFLAEGGITTGPTLAVIGEGREDEAVLPLSRLEQLISMPQDVRAPSVGKVQPQRVDVRLELSGPEEMKRLIRYIAATDGGGDPQGLFGY